MSRALVAALALSLLQFAAHMHASEGLLAQVYDNRNLSGVPVSTSVVPQLNAKWSAEGPVSGLVDNFSVRWSGTLIVPTSGNWTFTARSDDGVAVWIDDTLVISAWTDHGTQDFIATVDLAAGAHTVRVEYYEHTGSAECTLSWTVPGGTKVVIPPNALQPATPPTSPSPGDNGWNATYHTGVEFGLPFSARVDPAIDQVWNGAIPIDGIPATNFSARWIGYIDPPTTGAYTLFTQTDDGVRVWVNGSLVIDDWTAHAVKENSATIGLTKGTVISVVMEYYQASGLASARLLWSSPNEPKRPIPTAHISPATNLLTAPLFTHSSPINVECVSAQVANLTTHGQTFPLQEISEGHSFADVALIKVLPTIIKSNAKTALVSWWLPIVMIGDSKHSIRLNDALLFAAPLSGTLTLTDQYGVPISPEVPRSAGIFEKKFLQAGDFILTYRVQGQIVSHTSVRVISAALPSHIACKVNFSRHLTVESSHPRDLSIAGNLNRLVQVTAPDTWTFGPTSAVLGVKPLKRGTPRAVVRMKDTPNYIIAIRDIDEFTLELPRSNQLINARRRHGFFDIKITPWIPNLEIGFTMFASRSTFQEGVRHIDTNTNEYQQDSSTGETIGIFRLGTEVPTGETKQCLRMDVVQRNSPAVTVGSDTGNPKVIEVWIDGTGDCPPGPNASLAAVGTCCGGVVASADDVPRAWHRVDRILASHPLPTLLWKGLPLFAPRGVNRFGNLLFVTDPGDRTRPDVVPARIVLFDLVNGEPQVPPRIFFSRPGFLRTAKWSVPVVHHGVRKLIVADQGVELPDGTFTGEGAKVFLLPINDDDTAGEPEILWAGPPFVTPTGVQVVGEHLIITDPSAGPTITRPEKPDHPFTSSVIFSLNINGGEAPRALQRGAPFTSLIGICPAIPGWLIVNDTDSGRIDPTGSGGRPRQFAPPASADRWLIKIEDANEPRLGQPKRTPFFEEGPLSIRFNQTLSPTAKIGFRGLDAQIVSRTGDLAPGFGTGDPDAFDPTSYHEYPTQRLDESLSFYLNMRSDVQTASMSVEVSLTSSGGTSEDLTKDLCQPTMLADNKHGGAKRTQPTATATIASRSAAAAVPIEWHNHFTADNLTGQATIWIYPQGGGTPVAMARGGALIRTVAGQLNEDATQLWMLDQRTGSLFTIPWVEDAIFDSLFPEREIPTE